LKRGFFGAGAFVGGGGGGRKGGGAGRGGGKQGKGWTKLGFSLWLGEKSTGAFFFPAWG